MKKVLFILYYWPPSGGAGVQRCLKMVKYMRDFGWEPIVYTAKDAHYPIVDPTLEKDVHPQQLVLRHPIWEPYDLYRKFTGQKKEKRVYSGFMSKDQKPSFTQKASVWIRGNLFIPDARRFWIKPSVKFLTNYIKKHPVDAIISSGPPHSVHMIGRGVKRKTGIPWIADFRDPWTQIDFYDQLMLTGLADYWHKKLEKTVIKEASHLVTVSENWVELYKQLGAEKVRLIRNGFDHEDFEFEKPPLDTEFSCSHIGFLNQDRNSPELWEAFAALCSENQAFDSALKLRFIGKTDPSVFSQLDTLGLTDKVERIAYIPHNEVVKKTVSSQVLLLLVNDVPNVMGHIPGKTYEYVASGRPVLGIGPADADFAKVLRASQSGKTCEFGDKESMKKVLMNYFELFQKKQLSFEQPDLYAYTRKHATELMAQLLDELFLIR